MTESQSLLRVSGLDKSYPGVKALSGVTVEIKKGEVHALVGENGAGKSTFARIVAGLEKPDGGRMVFKGATYSPSGKVDAEHLGIRMVMQEMNLIPTLSVAENIFFDRIPNFMGIINRNRLVDKARTVMRELGLDGIEPVELVEHLGVGQQQMVEIAAGFSQRCELLILDEPTAALTDSEIDILFRQIERIKSDGVSVIYISHRIEEIKRISDRITVLRDGRKVRTQDTSDVSIDEVIQLMVGRKLRDVHPAEKRERGECALRVDGISKGDKVRDVSFELYRGEILGFSGMTGSGRTELMRLIFGADRMDSGKIYLHESESPVTIRSPRDAVRNGLALLTEDRKMQGLLMPLSVSVNTSLASMDDVSKFGWIHSSTERAVAEKYTSVLSIRCHSVEQTVKTLSGGNQQKVVIAKWLYRKPRILIFDEPTRGIDVGAKFEIYSLLLELARQGHAIIVVSSDMLELFKISDRIAVMSNGVLAKTFERDDWSQNKIMEAALSEYVSVEQKSA